MRWNSGPVRAGKAVLLSTAGLGIVLLIAAKFGPLLGEMPDPLRLHYGVEIVDPEAQILRVELRIQGSRAKTIELGYSPNAINQSAPTARYQLQGAEDAAGRPLRVEIGDGSWRIQGSQDLRFRYEVHLAEGQQKGVYAAELLSACDAGGARLLGADLFLFPIHAETGEIEAEYALPPGWKLIHPFQTGATSASYPDLRSLYFSVVAAGEYRTLSRDIAGSELVLAARGDFRFGDPDLMDTIARIARQQIEFFGDTMRPRYVFVVNPHPRGDDRRRLHYFGLHFDASMAILLDPRTDRLKLQAEPAHIVAHEFFHNWNGELIRQENYEMNWFIEGVTTYYSYKTCQEVRMLDGGGFVRELQSRYEKHYAGNPKRGEFSLAAAGETVLQNQDTTQLLYSGGMLAALALDIEIDRVSGHQRSLDDVMLDLAASARADDEWVLTRGTLSASLARLTGEDFEGWLERHIYGLESLDLPEYVLAVSR